MAPVWHTWRRGLLAPVTVVLWTTAVFCWPLFRPGWFRSDEAASYPLRLVAFHAFVEDRCPSFRWSTLMSQGYGYPFFDFYPPGVYVAAEGLHLLGFDYLDAYKALIVLLTLLQGIGVFALARSLFGPRAGVVAVAAYTLAPYHFACINRRGAIAEYAACAIAPFLFLTARRLLAAPDTGRMVAFAIAFAALPLTHNLGALLFACAVVVFIGIEGTRASPRVWAAALLALTLGLCLSAFFWAPAFFQRDLVHIEAALKDWFVWEKHFISPAELLGIARDPKLAARGVGPVALGLTILAVFRYRSHGRAFFAFLGLGLLASFMTLQASRPFWASVPLLPFFQFPWRFMMLASLAFAITASAAVPEEWGLGWHLAVAALLAVATGWYAILHRPMPVEEETLSRDYFLQNDVTTTFGEFLPVASQTPPERRERDFVADGAAFEGESRTACSLAADVVTQENVEVRVASFYFPGLAFKLDGEKVRPLVFDDGLARVMVPPGRHRLEVEYRGTELERAMDRLSMIGAFGLLALFGYHLYRRRCHAHTQDL